VLKGSRPWTILLLFIFLMAVVFILVIRIPGGAHAAGTCNVTPGTGAYPTINSATTDAACALVNVPAGTFVEQVTITHSLELAGAGQGKTIIKHPPPSSSTKQDQGADYVVLFLYSDVNMHDITVDGGGYSCIAAGTCAAGMLYALEFSAGEQNVHDVTCQDVGSPAINHDGSCVGLNTNETYIKQDQRITLQYNTYKTFTFTALRARDDGLGWGSYVNIYLTDSIITASGAGQYGIYNLPHQSQIYNNTFSGFVSGNAAGTLVQNLTGGIAIFTGHDSHESIETQNLLNNTFSNNTVALLFKGSGDISYSSGNTFTNNGIAIAMDGNLNGTKNGQGNTVIQTFQGNTISGTTKNTPVADSGTAILICDDNLDVFTHNTINNAAANGVQVCGSSSGNQFVSDTIHSDALDVSDQSTGGQTDGTANIYQGDTCSTSSPADLCAIAAAPPPTPTAAPKQPTPTAAPKQPTPTNVPRRPTSTAAPGQPTSTAAPGQPTSTAAPGQPTSTASTTVQPTETGAPPTSLALSSGGANNIPPGSGQGTTQQNADLSGLIPWIIALLVIIAGGTATMVVIRTRQKAHLNSEQT
jgi:hypothetical protein